MASRSFWASLGHAAAGFAYVTRTQRNARIQIAAGAAVAGLAVWLRLGPAELSVLAVCVGLVLAAECFNTAIEALIDRVSPEFHELAKAAKDSAAAAVLCLSGAAALAGACLLGPPLWQRLTGL